MTDWPAFSVIHVVALGLQVLLELEVRVWYIAGPLIVMLPEPEPIVHAEGVALAGVQLTTLGYSTRVRTPRFVNEPVEIAVPGDAGLQFVPVSEVRVW